MAKLAIRGSFERSKEVINILEMVGGINHKEYEGCSTDAIYYIDDNGYISFFFNEVFQVEEYCMYTINSFLKKFPYTVGDKVINKNDECVGVIDKVEWSKEESEIIYSVVFGNGIDFGWYKAQGLKPYKEEEKMEEKMEQKAINHVCNTEVISFDIAQKDEYELDLCDNFEVVLREGKYYVTRIKPRYPKTYEDCCKVLGIRSDAHLVYADGKNVEDSYLSAQECVLNNFLKLKICRDVYWKIAGIELGLGKPWEPDYLNPTKEIRYFIFCTGITIEKGHGMFPTNTFLIFPTEEMQDVFYENFKDLIESCKEFL